MKIWLILGAVFVVIVLVVVLLFVFLPKDQDNGTNLYKEIPGAVIPGQCMDFKTDVCGLFECAVDSCWCEESPKKILKVGNTELKTEDEAAEYVSNYLKEFGSEHKGIKAVKLNDLFYNVFVQYYNEEYQFMDEVVYTVAVDGTIISTQCGV
jgi:hypothetical protein